MNQDLLSRQVKRYGNSGGVYLPASWVGGEVEVRLISRPANPVKDLLAGFSSQMSHIAGIFIFGSVSREDYSPDSDIDVLVITDGTRLKNPGLGNKYDIRVVGIEKIEEALSKDPLFRKSLDDMEPVINADLLKKLRSIPLDRSSLEDRIELSESSLSIIKRIYETGGGENLVYPIVMRLKELLIIRCILEDKRYSQKLLKKALSGLDSDKILEYYRSIRDSRKPPDFDFEGKVVKQLIDILERLLHYVKKEEARQKRD